MNCGTLWPGYLLQKRGINEDPQSLVSHLLLGVQALVSEVMSGLCRLSSERFLECGMEKLKP